MKNDFLKLGILFLICFALFFCFGCARDNNVKPIYVQLYSDKDEYEESNTVFFALYITNLGNFPVGLDFRNRPGFDIFVLNDNTEIWNWRKNAWTEAWTYTLAGGQSLVYGEDKHVFWTKVDNEGISVSSGKYEIYAILDTDNEFRSESIFIDLR